MPIDSSPVISEEGSGPASFCRVEGAGQREVSIHWPGRIFYRVEKAVWRRAGR